MNQTNILEITQTKIDNLEFARKSLKIHGIILVSNFLRLKDELSSSAGQLDCILEGALNAEGLPSLRLTIKGVVQLLCQRCLEPFDYRLDILTEFLVVPAEAIPEPEDEPDEVDFLEQDSQMSVLGLIEDEVLLDLPLAPKHPMELCDAAKDLNELKKPSPFAALAALKKS